MLARHFAIAGYPGEKRVENRLWQLAEAQLPLRHIGRYDFAASDLPARVRRLGFELAVRRRLLRPPRPESLFLHRKLVGSYMLLVHIGAQVDVRALILPFLPKA